MPGPFIADKSGFVDDSAPEGAQVYFEYMIPKDIDLGDRRAFKKQCPHILEREVLDQARRKDGTKPNYKEVIADWADVKLYGRPSNSDDAVPADMMIKTIVESCFKPYQLDQILSVKASDSMPDFYCWVPGKGGKLFRICYHPHKIYAQGKKVEVPIVGNKVDLWLMLAYWTELE